MKLLDIVIISLLCGTGLFVVYAFTGDTKNVASAENGVAACTFEKIVVHQGRCSAVYKAKEMKVESDFVISANGKVEEALKFEKKLTGEVKQSSICILVENFNSRASDNALKKLIFDLSKRYHVPKENVFLHRCN